ncbi:hypothetical protein C2S29_06990 [Helicobacter pylori]|nr:hypothetical protein C2S29_06990 [Helicobacter pylori]
MSLIIGILQSLSSNAFLTALTHRIYKGITLRAFYARYKCMGVLYYKDIWDFCLGGLKKRGFSYFIFAVWRLSLN